MLNACEENCEITAMDLSRDKKINHNNVHPSTVNRFLNTSGYVAMQKVNVNEISDINI
jgi:hypothetical protein